ncbi:hypothetical protein ACFQY4_40920 [Catellatospora bangladeshensis]|uniref:hypothetical protein n=1 Tax=Catellatospora bangladeshensis TaxID=310355 RepID=UPI00361D4CAD
MAGWSVMLRGIRHRSGRSLVVLSLAAFATAAAVLAPAYGRAAQQSVLTDALSAAPATAAAVTVTADGSADTAEAAHQPVGDTQAVVGGALARSPRLSAVLDRPVGAVSTDTSLNTTGVLVSPPGWPGTRAPARTCGSPATVPSTPSR